MIKNHPGFTFLQSKKAKLLLQFKNSGFTLIEILVVVVLLGVAGVVAIPNLRKFGTDQELEIAVNNLRQGLRIAQSSATSGTKCSTKRAISWKVKLEGTKFTVYAVCKDPTDPSSTDELRSQTLYAPSILMANTTCQDQGRGLGADIIFSAGSLSILCANGSAPLSSPPFAITIVNSANNSQTNTINISTGGVIN